MTLEEKFKKNFARVIELLKDSKDMNYTSIAKSLGYTSTTQLHHSVSGKGLPSTKAIISLVENLKVNPTYLFFGEDDIFLSDESEIDRLRKENRTLIENHDKAVKTVVSLNEIIEKLQKRNEDLIELSSAAIKYHKENKGSEDKQDE